MKKIISLILTVSFILSLSVMFGAFEWLGEYTDSGYTDTAYNVPEAAVTPVLDGAYDATEWLGAYHHTVSASGADIFSMSGYDYFYSPAEPSESSTFADYDLYMMWVEGDAYSNHAGTGDGGLYICVVANDTDPGGVIDPQSASNGPQDGIQLGVAFNYGGTQSDTVYIFDFAATSSTGEPCSFEHVVWRTQCPFIQMSSTYNYQTGYTMEIFIPWIAANESAGSASNYILPDYGTGVTLKAGFVFKDGGGNDIYYEGRPSSNINPGERNVSSWNYYAIDFGSGISIETAFNSVSNLDTVTLTSNSATSDFSALRPLLREVSELDAATYTAETWNPLNTAYTTALTFNGLTAQTDIDAMVTTLTTHIGNLVIAHQLTGLSITNLPSKLYYALGTEFDSTGLVVSGSYSDNVPGEITGYQVSGFDSSADGTVVVTVAYGGFSDTFNVTVYKRGDLDSSSSLTSADARIALVLSLSSGTPGAYELASGDADNNGTITSADARIVLVAALGSGSLD